MMRRIPGLVVIVMLAMTSASFAVQYPLAVTGLSVEGNNEIKLRDILAVVHFDVGDEIAEADLKAASQAIYDLGWFGEVALDRTALEMGNVVFRVIENPVIRRIEIIGNVNRRDYSLFGIKLFDAPIVSDSKVRHILSRNDVRRRKVLNHPKLTAALEEVLAEYESRGYVLISVGNVDMSETLSIELVEHRYAGSLVSGLRTVPDEVALALIDIPDDQPLLLAGLQRAIANLNQSVFFVDVTVAPQAGLVADAVWLQWTLSERGLLEGPTPIRGISIEGNTIYNDELLKGLLGELPAGPVDNYGLLEMVQGVHDRYVRDGYSLVQLSTSAIDDGIVRMNVAEGEISHVSIQGNSRTREYVIDRNLSIQTGKVFNRNDLIVSYQRLMGLDYFTSVNIAPNWADGMVQVVVGIEEKTNLGGLSGSMSIDPESKALFGEVSVNQKNVFGTGQDLQLSYNRGLAGVKDVNPATWSLGYGTVAFFPGFDRVGAELYRRTREVTIDDDKTVVYTLGGEISFSYPVADYVVLGIAFRREGERIGVEGPRWVSADVLNVSVSYNDTTDPAFPTDGNRRTVSIEKAGGFSLGEEYAKVDFEWICFRPAKILVSSSEIEEVIAIRVKAGWADAGTPETHQFRLGGPMSIRAISGDPARQYALANLEYRIELAEGLYVTAFCDAGVDLLAVRVDKLLSSVGFEVGIAAAGTFVRLDLAWLTNKDNSWLPVFDIGFSRMF